MIISSFFDKIVSQICGSLEKAYSGTSTLLLLAQSLQVCFLKFSLDVFQFTALPGQLSYFSRLSAFRLSSFIFALSVDIKSTALGEDRI